MKKLSKLLLAISFAVSMATSAFAVTVVSWVELTQNHKS
jgi:putative spermidine/putrescine transport system substrate-binding protein